MDPPPTDLPQSLFTRLDESPDELFYATPRFVTHIDDAAIEAALSAASALSQRS